PYGGKYRIIDFPLSNCTNSGIDVVGVLTQYRPLELNAYIGSGSPWDLDLSNGGVYVLPPYHSGKTGEWYKGTANAIYQNIPFIAQWDPEYVLVLSGDHIYKMDYNAMLQSHIQNGADLTIAVREVPWAEASRFGILNTDENNQITEFEEKPKNPKSNKASMGVYIFSWSKMRKYLEQDELNPNSDNDFGKNIIPDMLADNQKLFTYTFDGYWKDVGTIESLWEANMDLLEMPMPIDLYDARWRIYARNPGMPPHYIAEGAKVVNSLITEGCEVRGVINHSVLFAGVTVETGAEITDAVIMPGAVIERGAVVRRAIVGENAHICAGAVVGEETGLIAVVGPKAEIASGDKVAAGVQIDADAQ
ncbi:MAG: glucose-1-phosphate adenylyltransferase, partial [Candidatus Ventricola sp.]